MMLKAVDVGTNSNQQGGARVSVGFLIEKQCQIRRLRGNLGESVSVDCRLKGKSQETQFVVREKDK